MFTTDDTNCTDDMLTFIAMLGLGCFFIRSIRVIRSNQRRPGLVRQIGRRLFTTDDTNCTDDRLPIIAMLGLDCLSYSFDSCDSW